MCKNENIEFFRKKHHKRLVWDGLGHSNIFNEKLREYGFDEIFISKNSIMLSYLLYIEGYCSYVFSENGKDYTPFTVSAIASEVPKGVTEKKIEKLIKRKKYQAFSLLCEEDKNLLFNFQPDFHALMLPEILVFMAQRLLLNDITASHPFSIGFIDIVSVGEASLLNDRIIHFLSSTLLSSLKKDDNDTFIPIGKSKEIFLYALLSERGYTVGFLKEIFTLNSKLSLGLSRLSIPQITSLVDKFWSKSKEKMDASAIPKWFALLLVEHEKNFHQNGQLPSASAIYSLSEVLKKRPIEVVNIFSEYMVSSNMLEEVYDYFFFKESFDVSVADSDLLSIYYSDKFREKHFDCSYSVSVTCDFLVSDDKIIAKWKKVKIADQHFSDAVMGREPQKYTSSGEEIVWETSKNFPKSGNNPSVSILKSVQLLLSS